MKTFNAKAQRRKGAKRVLKNSFFAALWCGLLIACAFALSISPARAQVSGFGWREGDLAFLLYGLPEHHEGEGRTYLTSFLPGVTTFVELLPETTLEREFSAALGQRLLVDGNTNYQYQTSTWFGRSALRGWVEGTTPTGWGVRGRGRIGRLPDGRVLAIYEIGDGTITEAHLDEVAYSVVFSAESTPMPPAYRPIWIQPAPDMPALITGITAALDRIYAVDIERGVLIYSAASGAIIASYPFQNPAQPTSIAVDAAGVVYVGDKACRCIRRMLPNGFWLDSIGEFGANAPFDLAAAGMTVYAADMSAEGYALRIFGEGRERTILLNFNGAAPPLVAPGTGGVYVLEWLSSLMDDEISGALSAWNAEQGALALDQWLPFTPDTVRDLAQRRHLAIAGDGITFVVDAYESAGRANLYPPFPPVALAFDEAGLLYVAGKNGELAAYSDRLPPERIGDERLRPGVPVQGVLSEASPVQSWTYEGRAGEVISLQAVDLARGDYTAVGLDMDITLLAPDGSQVAYNDDQRGDALFGIYDAHIPDARLPADGVYTVNVGWRQGAGTYTLGLSRPAAFALEGGVMRLEGRLQDVFPTAYYRFEGRAGQTLTFTMRAESGTLDPALTLRAPDGSLFAYNDDAADPELGVDAQIVRAVLPADGVYTLEAGRYEGVGRFSLVVVEN